MRKRIGSWLSLIIPIVIIVALFLQTRRAHPDALNMLLQGPRSPLRLCGCFGLIVAASALSFLRWHLLLRTVHIPIRLRDTMRLGFLGQLLTFVSPGHVGGDLFKAVFIAREQRGRRAEAVGTILVDRVCGLYGLLLVATAALLISRVDRISPSIAVIARGTYVLTAIFTVAAVLVLTPQIAKGPWVQRLTRIPRVGPAFERLLRAVYLFQDSKFRLAAIGVTSLGVHILIALAIYLAATGLYAETPDLADILVASPIACVAGALPITPGGLGSYELAMTYVYDLLSPPNAQGRGIVIAICYRLGTFFVAAIGIVFYWMRHRELDKIIREAEAQSVLPPAETVKRSMAAVAEIKST